MHNKLRKIHLKKPSKIHKIFEKYYMNRTLNQKQKVKTFIKFFQNKKVF